MPRRLVPMLATACGASLVLGLGACSTEPPNHHLPLPAWVIASEERRAAERRAEAEPITVKNGNVPNWRWVRVRNAVNNGNDSLKSGDTCGIDFPGRVEAVDTHGATTLVRYTAPAPAFGTECPSGAKFYLPTSLFQALPQRYAHVAGEYKTQQAAVQRYYTSDKFGNALALTAKPTGPATRTKFRWVRVMNLTPVKSLNVTHFFWDVCSIAHGTAQVIGTVKGEKLMLFTTSRDRAGAECPSGTLYLRGNQQENLPNPSHRYQF